MEAVAVREEPRTEFATKLDLEILKGELREDIARLDGKIDTVKGELREDITRLDGKIDTVKTELNGEIKLVREEIKTSNVEITSKIRLYFLILIFTMILLNPKAIDLIAKLIGVSIK